LLTDLLEYPSAGRSVFKTARTPAFAPLRSARLSVSPRAQKAGLAAYVGTTEGLLSL
jgi:hypothetical protein